MILSAHLNRLPRRNAHAIAARIKWSTADV